jgi:hypothetical protein
MLTGNLATRPFYNERLVGLALLAVGLLTAAITFFNARELVGLTRERAALGGRIAENQSTAARIDADAAALQQSVDRATLVALAASAREANDLVAQRTFSWTAFFGLIERTLPFDVRLVAVSPRTERGIFRIQMSVIARDLDDVDEFTTALLGTTAFRDVVPLDQRAIDDGTYGALLEALYVPVKGDPEREAPAPPAASNAPIGETTARTGAVQP